MKDISFQAITSNAIASIKVALNNLDTISVPLQIGNAFTNYFQLINDPTGFPNRVDSTISINNATRTFSISPTNTSFSIYYKGNEFIKSSAETFTFANVEGIHHIYYNQDGELAELLAFDIDLIKEFCYVANFYWSVSQQRILFDKPNDERHSIFMDNNTHYYLHSVNGSKYKSGFSITNVLVDQDGSSNTHSNFNVTQGEFFDEDILFNHTPTTTFNVLYREGTQWRVKEADNFPLIYDGINTIKFNPLIGNEYSLQNATEGSYILMHVIAINEPSSKVAVFVGNNEYTDIDIARQSASDEIEKISGLPMAEFIPIGTLIFQTSSLYTNATKARTIAVDESGSTYVDFRFTKSFNASGSIGIVASHSLLSHLELDDHKQYLNIERGDARYYTETEIDTTLLSYQNKTILDTKGDIYVRDNTNVIKKAIGVNYEVLSVDTLSNTNLSYRNVGSILQPNKDITIYDDFTSIATNDEFSLVTTGGSIAIGALNGVVAGQNNVGIYTLSSGNTNSNFGSYILGNSSGSGYFAINGDMIYETLIYLPILSTSTVRYYSIFGISDSITSSATDNTVDGIYFFYFDATSLNWIIKTRSNSVESTLTTSVAVTANTWIKLRIEYTHATTTATFFINNTNVGSLNTNIPLTLARASGLNIKMQKTVGNGQRYCGIDYIYFNHYYTEGNKR